MRSPKALYDLSFIADFVQEGSFPANAENPAVVPVTDTFSDISNLNRDPFAAISHFRLCTYHLRANLKRKKCAPIHAMHCRRDIEARCLFINLGGS